MTDNYVGACRLAVELSARTGLVTPASLLTVSRFHPLLLDFGVHIVELQLS